MLLEEKCGCEHDHEEDECCCGHHHEHHEDECCCGHHHDHPEIGEECDCPDCEGHDHDRTISSSMKKLVKNIKDFSFFTQI